MTDLAAPSNASDAAAALNGSFPADDAAGQTVAAMAESEKISADEIALYDRQIRLWGVKAQEKIRTANILLVSIKALANEIAKNLVLAGIGSITLADHENVSEDDLGAQFFISDADVGKNRAEAAAPQVRKLNPRVKVNTYTSPITTETEASFYAQFDVIIATDLDFNSTNTLNLCARLANRPFYAGASHGLYGYIFADLIQHKFVVERDLGNKTTQVGPESSTRSILETSSKKDNGKSVETVTKQEIYSPIMAIKDSPLPPELANNQRRLRKVHPLLTCVRALWEYQFKAHGVLPSHDPQQLQLFTMMATDKHKLHMLPSSTLTAEFLRSFLQNLGSEIAPITAFLGGQLAQDVINVLGQREQPIQNLLLFDGEECAGPVYALHPIFADNPIAALPSIPMPVEAIAIDD